MSKTQPIKTQNLIKKAIAWLTKNSDSAYPLLYKIMVMTGLRVTDTTEIKYSDIDYDELTITIEENKGTRSNKARAKLKILEKWHANLFRLEADNKELREELFLSKPKHLLNLFNLPMKYFDTIQHEIIEAQRSAKIKIRVVDITHELAQKLKKRQEENKGNDDGFLFAKKIMRSNRARGWKKSNNDQLPVVTRQSVLNAFKIMQEALKSTGTKIKAHCHGLRKTFARFLYNANKKDLNIVMTTMGWSDIKMVMMYLGYDEEQRKTANNNAHLLLADI